MGVTLNKGNPACEEETGLTRAQFEEYISKNTPIDGFIGAVEIPISDLDNEVPEQFPDRVYVDDKGNEHVYTWREYWNYISSRNNALIMLDSGRLGNNCRREPLTDSELRRFVSYFNVRNVMTRSEMKTKLCNDYINEPR